MYCLILSHTFTTYLEDSTIQSDLTVSVKYDYENHEPVEVVEVIERKNGTCTNRLEGIGREIVMQLPWKNIYNTNKHLYT